MATLTQLLRLRQICCDPRLIENEKAESAKLDAFRNAACWMSLVYLIGLAALPFLPETKGEALPED